MNTPSGTLESEIALKNNTLVGAFFANVYKWMTIAMVITGAVAWFTAQWKYFGLLVEQYPLLILGMFGAELLLVWIISGRAQKLSAGVAIGLFMLYSALSGLTLSMIFVYYPIADIFKAFVAAGGMFAGMSLFGYTTKRDLSGWGSFLFMALIGLIVASVVNLWIANDMMEWMINYGGVVIFAGLAAYDHQKLKAYALAGHNSTGIAVRGALELYLDFINLFLFLLRLFNRR